LGEKISEGKAGKVEIEAEAEDEVEGESAG